MSLGVLDLVSVRASAWSRKNCSDDRICMTLRCFWYRCVLITSTISSSFFMISIDVTRLRSCRFRGVMMRVRAGGTMAATSRSKLASASWVRSSTAMTARLMTELKSSSLTVWIMKPFPRMPNQNSVWCRVGILGAWLQQQQKQQHRMLRKRCTKLPFFDSSSSSPCERFTFPWLAAWCSVGIMFFLLLCLVGDITCLGVGSDV
mmetsp:Transcript_36432/g.73539  ORF Transcript_36432/g.73539 Transcript_36432/m.73539 type:complete len:204 (-) Transcript_36432:71-682(-)